MKKNCSKLILMFLLAVLFSAAVSSHTINIYDGTELINTYEISNGEYCSLPDATIKDSKALLGFSEKGSTELYGYRFMPERDMELYAVWTDIAEPLPGTNIIPYGDFESGPSWYIRPSNGKVSIIEEDGNNLLEYTRGSNYASVQFPVRWDAGRTYRLSYRVRTSGNTSSMYNPRYHKINDASSASTDHPLTSGSTGVMLWQEFSADFVIPEDHCPNPLNDLFSLYCNPIQSQPGTVYYDDIILVPYYKITYHTSGGTSVPEEYVLADMYAVTETVPAKRGFRFGGWSLTDGGTEPISEIQLQNTDVDLYAIWVPISESDVISWEFDSDKKGVSDGVVTIMSPAGADNYTDVKLLYSDENGNALSGYTPLASLALENGTATYTIKGSHTFPKSAASLTAVFSADGLPELEYSFKIPEEKLYGADELPLFTFYAVSDLHLSDYWPEMAVNRTNMLEDILANTPDFVVLNGDLVNNGTSQEYQRLDDVLQTWFNDNDIPAFITNGNHEFYVSDKNTLNYDREGLLNSFSLQLQALADMGYEIERPENELWYSTVINGYKFIFLSVPSTSSPTQLANYTMSDEQLAFLEKELYDCEKSDVTAFVFSHVPLADSVPEQTTQIANSDEVSEIISKHPNAVFVSGHTHSNLSKDIDFVSIGNMTDTFTSFNDGCAVWLSGGSSKYGSYEVEFSAGQVVEVYEDKIIIKARKFDDTCEFFSHALYTAELPKSEKELPDVTISGGDPANGAFLSANLSGGVSDTEYTYEWIVDGEVVCTESVYNVQAKYNFGGKYVFLRVYSPDGGYSSAVTAKPFAGVTLHYDANGAGSGSIPADQICIPGIETPIDVSGYAQKPGLFFIGWSEDPSATEPQLTVNITEDTTVYAVYTDIPFFGFDASFSGWRPNAAVKTSAVESGCLTYSSDPGADMYFTLSGINLDADTNKYMRIKSVYESGVGDSMFFSTSESGFNSSKTRIPLDAGEVVSAAGGMNIIEYDILSFQTSGDYWKGTVTGLRYDVLGSGGVGATDYIEFTDKRGIYVVSLTTDAENREVLLSEDTVNCSITDTVWNEDYALITLSAHRDYEFVNDPDVIGGFSANGKAATVESVSDEAITFRVDFEYDGFILGGMSEEFVTYEVTSPEFFEKYVIAALFDQSGRIIDTQIKQGYSVSQGKISVRIPSSYGSGCLIKIFVFENQTSLSPEMQALSREIE